MDNPTKYIVTDKNTIQYIENLILIDNYGFVEYELDRLTGSMREKLLTACSNEAKRKIAERISRQI